MDLEKIRKSLDELLEVTHGLANDNPVPESKSRYLRVLEGTFRKNYVRLQAIGLLMKHTTTAHVAMEITRNMVEDVIAVEYMRLKGAEEYAERFFQYWTVHYYKITHQDLGKGTGISKEEIEEAEKRYAKLPRAVKNRKNWAGCDVATQLKFVLDSEALSERDVTLTEIAYTFGSLKTHFNPYDIMVYLHGDYFEHSSEFTLQMSLIFALSSQVRLTTRYIDAINEDNGNNDYAHYGHKANDIINQYNQPGSSQAP